MPSLVPVRPKCRMQPFVTESLFHMRSLRLLTFLFVMPLSIPAIAGAGTPGASVASLKAACTADYVRFCDGLDPSGGEVVACFRRNIRAVAPGCRKAIAEHTRSAKRTSLDAADTRQDIRTWRNP